MLNHSFKPLLPILALALWGIALRPLLISVSVNAQPPTAQTVKDNEELKRLCDEDQSDRASPDRSGRSIDWSVVGPRDKARLARVKELYMQNRLHTGADYYRAALILQHGDLPDDFLLAHEFCIVALSKGFAEAKWLAAASEDRFLENIGRPQRFGTQYKYVGPNKTVQLYIVDSGVTDNLRRELNVPSLADAKKTEAELNKRQ
jgi:hypothetical protein